MSEELDVVNSPEWANLIPENGLDGVPIGTSPMNKGKKNLYKTSIETKQKISDANKGRKFGPQSENHRKNLSESTSRYLTGRKLPEEWRKSLSLAKRGKNTGPLSLEHREKIAEGCKGINVGPQNKVICPHCGKEGGVSNMKRWHFENCGNPAPEGFGQKIKNSRTGKKYGPQKNPYLRSPRGPYKNGLEGG